MKALRNVLIVLIILAGAAGLYAGDIAYNEFMEAPWDQVLGIENHKGAVTAVREKEKNDGWEAVQINSDDGLILRGTYIAAAQASEKAVILLHGLYQNRSMCIPFVDMYHTRGYNVLIVDQRGHGESQGEGTTWGIRETDDMDGWVRWLKQRKKQERIGLHGVSLGAAMALLYAGSEKGKDTAFVIADSSYGNIIDLGREKIAARQGGRDLVVGYNILLPFFQAAMFRHTRKTVARIEPSQAVKALTVPVLFLHGEDDGLVPSKTAEHLYAMCGSPRKYIHLFRNSAHAVGVETNYAEYVKTVDDFLDGTEDN